MEKKEIKEVFDNVQKLLETLQTEDATCLFISGENHFTIGGDYNTIIAQLLIAMTRYPVVKAIVYTCAQLFEKTNEIYGQQIKDIKMDHLIEQNSANDN